MECDKEQKRFTNERAEKMLGQIARSINSNRDIDFDSWCSKIKDEGESISAEKDSLCATCKKANLIKVLGDCLLENKIKKEKEDAKRAKEDFDAWYRD